MCQEDKEDPIVSLKVVELFAGVGGFRLGLEGWQGCSPSSGYKNPIEKHFKVIWSNQWEPSTKKQHANLIYRSRWPDSDHSEKNIEEVIDKNFEIIPDHDLLVAGFPCQDYSVATTLKNAKGLIGKKGVLWWSIYTILKRKKGKRPKYLILENVDRLLISPANQRGRDFAIILSCLNELGYNVEWRVINAADYGMPQRRRRIFMVAYLDDTSISRSMSDQEDARAWLYNSGILASAFSVANDASDMVMLDMIDGPIDHLSKTFNKDGKHSPFKNTGMLRRGKIYTVNTCPSKLGKNEKMTLGDILEKGSVDDEFLINEEKRLNKKMIKKQLSKDGPIIIKTELDMWKYYKGPKKEERINRINNIHYNYAEGGMEFPDRVDRASRTIITGEGGPSPSRFKHVIRQDSTLRRLTPLELERLNMFPDDHTRHDSIRNGKRAFFMGNALVVGVVERIGRELINKIT